jgi:release factor glutamine methyltransferase
MPDSPQTVKQILEASVSFLEKKRILEARPSCELLISRLLNCGRLDLHMLADKLLSDKQLDAMRRGLKRLSEGEPVQYIIGKVDFMNLQFKTDKRALIPRPETELLVEEALKLKNEWLLPENCIVLDVGTGSGCIIISLAASLSGPVFIGTDTSSEAIGLAKENADSILPTRRSTSTTATSTTSWNHRRFLS